MEIPKEFRKDIKKIKYILKRINKTHKWIPGDKYYFQQLVLDKKGYIKFDSKEEKWYLTSEGKRLLESYKILKW